MKRRKRKRKRFENVMWCDWIGYVQYGLKFYLLNEWINKHKREKKKREREGWIIHFTFMEVKSEVIDGWDRWKMEEGKKEKGGEGEILRPGGAGENRSFSLLFCLYFRNFCTPYVKYLVLEPINPPPSILSKLIIPFFIKFPLPSLELLHFSVCFVWFDLISPLLIQTILILQAHTIFIYIMESPK